MPITEEELRNKICDAIFPPSDHPTLGRMEYRGGIGVQQTGDFQVSGNFEPAIDRLLQLIHSYTEAARLNERKQVALDNYRGQTFSEDTNYQGKFEKFVRNNELVIARLTQNTKENK